MTVQAFAWAFDQPVPGNAGRVLLALGNHADHTNGRVHFDATTIAAEALIQVASLPRYLAALERNGYLSKDELKSPDGDKREYWLVLDRDRALPWSWSAHDGDAEESQDADSAEKGSAPPARSAPSAAPAAFRRDRQVQAREEIKAAEPIPPPGQVPVIEGSRAFREWTSYLRGRREIMPYVRFVLADGKHCRGVYMPSLFPPADRNFDEVKL